MRLTEAARALLGLQQEPDHGEAIWQDARGRFAYALFSNWDEQAIREVLNLDSSDTLPVDLKRATYERLIEISGRRPEDLKNYAWYLQLHGPEWDDYAHSLLKEADEHLSPGNGGAEALLCSAKISYGDF